MDYVLIDVTVKFVTSRVFMKATLVTQTTCLAQRFSL